METMKHEFSVTRGLAKIISILFHPLLMPSYGFALLFFTHNYISTFIALQYKLVLLAATFVFTFLLPAINALILYKMGRISSLEMENASDRTIPYGSAALYYFALYYLFYKTGFPPVFKLFILGAGISILLTLLINYRWKISAHTVGIGGMVGALLGIIFRMQLELMPVFLLAVFFAGLVGTARLKLQAHSPAQVYTGFLLGFITEFSLLLFF